MEDSSLSGARPPLLSIRTALVLLLALLADGVVTVLWFAAGRPLAEAIVSGLVAVGGALIVFHQIVGS
jgi:hypothetical protein